MIIFAAFSRLAAIIGYVAVALRISVAVTVVIVRAVTFCLLEIAVILISLLCLSIIGFIIG